MRCTQVQGLPQDAYKWIAKNGLKETIKTCPYCKKSIAEGLVRRLCGSAKDEGMFDDGPDLYKYETKTGWVFEKVQAAPWSSGPVIFLMLVDIKGRILFKWSDKEINEA